MRLIVTFTPGAINDLIVRALQAPDVKERFIAQGLDIVGNRPEEMHAYLKAEIARWSGVVKAAGIKPD